MGLISWFKDFFARIRRVFISIVSEAISDVEKRATVLLWDIAKQAVREMANVEISNTEKLATAAKKIGDYAKSEGIEVGNSYLNWLGETAWKKVQKEFE